MKEITLRHEQPQIKIDGIVFDLKMSDYDVIKRCQEIFTKYQGYAEKEHAVDELLADLEDIRSTVDAMRGDGAMKKLSRGLPVGISLAIEWVAAISTAMSEEYAEAAVR